MLRKIIQNSLGRDTAKAMRCVAFP